MKPPAPSFSLHLNISSKDPLKFTPPPVEPGEDGTVLKTGFTRPQQIVKNGGYGYLKSFTMLFFFSNRPCLILYLCTWGLKPGRSQERPDKRLQASACARVRARGSRLLSGNELVIPRHIWNVREPHRPCVDGNINLTWHRIDGQFQFHGGCLSGVVEY